MEENSRPHFETVEMQSDPAQPEPAPVVAEPVPANTPFRETPQQTQTPELVVNTPYKEHPLRKFIFLVPALIVVIAIVVAAYFTRTDFIIRNTNEALPTPSIMSPTPAPTQAPAVSLLRYSNEEYRFQYPRVFTIVACSEKTYLVEVEAGELNLDEYCADPSNPVAVISKSSSAFNFEKEEVLSAEDIMVSGFSVTRREIKQGEVSWVVIEVPFKKAFYTLTLQQTMHENDFNTVLSTFELLDDPTAEWEVLDNSDYKYRISYPPGWDVEPGQKTLIKKVSSDAKLNTLTIEANLNAEDTELTANETISSAKSLPGWAATPMTELRNINGSNAAVIKGIYEGNWYAYVVVWRGRNIYQMTWLEPTDRENEENFELMISTFKTL